MWRIVIVAALFLSLWAGGASSAHAIRPVESADPPTPVAPTKAPDAKPPALAVLVPDPKPPLLPAEIPNPKPTVYVALSASDGLGMGSAGPHESWVARVHERMGKRTKLVNIARPNALVWDINDAELKRAVEAKPQVVTVWLGVNDFRLLVPLSEYSKQLDQTLAALKKTGAEVYVGNLPDVSLLPWVPPFLKSFVRSEAERWNAEIKVQARRNGAHVVDLFAGLYVVDPNSFLSPDGFHPNAAGYRRVAEVFWSQMSARGWEN